jgi:hypothetical protein
VQCDCEQQDRWFQRFDIVTLRRHRDQVTRPQLDLYVTGMDHDATLQAEHRGIPRTLVLTHYPPRGERRERLPEPSTSSAVDRHRTAPTLSRHRLAKQVGRQLVDRRNIHQSIIARLAHPAGVPDVGDVNGIPATGREVSDIEGISVHRMEDGKIAETWQLWDTLGFLQQLGVIPAT